MTEGDYIKIPLILNTYPQCSGLFRNMHSEFESYFDSITNMTKAFVQVTDKRHQRSDEIHYKVKMEAFIEELLYLMEQQWQ